MLKKIVIWGASSHAMVVADIIKQNKTCQLIGFLDDVNTERHHTLFCGLPILGGREQLDELKAKGIDNVIIGIGDCHVRLSLAELVRAHGLNLQTVVHPRSVIADDVTIGDGTVVVAGAVINTGSKIGENVIINTMASVDHECTVEDGVHLCPGVHVAGRVTIGRASQLSIGAVVKDRIRIGAGSIIGAGAVVIRDIPDGVVAYGTPAKIIKRIELRG
jgi:UDP-N-acetylbacillosamine N-acetyltransferase